MTASGTTSDRVTATLPRYSLFAAFLAAAGLPIYIHAPKFYVDEYGVGLASIGSALLLLRLIDVVQDPLLGRLAGRLRRGRPLAAMIAGLAMCLGMIGLFAVPAPVAPLLWMSACLVLLFSGFSFLTILFYARGIAEAAELGGRGHVRLAGWREAGALLGVSIACLAPFVLQTMGLPPYAGFAIAYLVLAVLAIVAMHPIWARPVQVLDGDFRFLLRDAGIRRLLLIAFLNSAPVAVTSTLFLFFVEYRLGQPQLAGLYLLTFFLAAALAAPFWSRWARHSGEVRVLTIGMTLSIVAFAWALFLGTGDGVQFLLICIASGAALGADMTLLPAIFADRVDRTGGNGGDAFGLWSFFTKLTLAIAAVTTLPLLQLGGFTPGQDNSENALWVLSLLYALVPCLLKVIALVLLNLGPKRQVVPC